MTNTTNVNEVDSVKEGEWIMALVLLESKSEEHLGYGAGSGTIDTDIYKCPCGKGTIKFVYDRIPGFRDKDVFIDCPECAVKYKNARRVSDFD